MTEKKMTMDRKKKFPQFCRRSYELVYSTLTEVYSVCVVVKQILGKITQRNHERDNATLQNEKKSI